MSKVKPALIDWDAWTERDMASKPSYEFTVKVYDDTQFWQADIYEDDDFDGISGIGQTVQEAIEDAARMWWRMQEDKS